MMTGSPTTMVRRNGRSGFLGACFPARPAPPGGSGPPPLAAHIEGRDPRAVRADEPSVRQFGPRTRRRLQVDLAVSRPILGADAAIGEHGAGLVALVELYAMRVELGVL